MSAISNLQDCRFERLTVVSRTSSDSRGRSKWLCRCDCGNTVIARADSLKRGDVKSCGCYHRENVATYARKHGMSGEKLYSVWANMKNRCFCPTHKRYKDYGGRGILVCGDWANSFLAFYTWAMESGYEPGLTIDRIDVNGNYEPENCRWLSNAEQQKNKRKSRGR